MEKYDVIIIGAGPGGYDSAVHLAKHGKSVLVFEKVPGHLGGTCLNEGCIPVKSMLQSAHLYKDICAAQSFGVELSGSAALKREDVTKRAKAKSAEIVSQIEYLFKQHGVKVEYAAASFESEKVIRAEYPNGETKAFEADNIIIATGSKTKEPPIPGAVIDEKDIYSSTGLINETQEIDELLIIGGGVIGCEFASYYSMAGAKVSIVEFADSLLPYEDNDVSSALRREFKKAKVKVNVSTAVKSIQKKDGGGFVVEMENSKGKTSSVETTKILVSIGREANTQGLNLEKAGVEMDGQFIRTDDRMRTSAEGIYAAGDIVKSPMLAHSAYREGLIAAEEILGARSLSVDNKFVPRVVFTLPQTASIGINEDEAKESGREYRVHKAFFKANAKALVEGSSTGFIKLISTAGGKILGASIVGASATELIHIINAAASADDGINVLKQNVFAHPTLSELIAGAIEG